MSAVYDEPRVHDSRVTPEAGWTPPPPRPPRPPRRTHPLRLLAGAIAGLVLVGVAVETIPPGTPGHQVWTSVVGAAPVAASNGSWRQRGHQASALPGSVSAASTAAT